MHSLEAIAVFFFSKRRQPSPIVQDQAQPAPKPRGGFLQYPALLISAAEKLRIDTSPERALLERGYSMSDPVEVYHIEREILTSLSEKIIAHLIENMKKRIIVTEEVEHLLRSAKADYLLATPESLARAETTVQKVLEKAETIHHLIIDTKKRLDEVFDMLSLKAFKSERMKAHHEKILKQTEDAIDMLLEDRIHQADHQIKSILEDIRKFIILEERAKHAVDKASLLIQQVSELGMKSEASKLEKILISSKVLLDAEEFEGAYTAANSIIYMAKESIPDSMRLPWEYICPICFHEVCPDCELKINGAVRCHFGCECGTGYHLCCISRHINFPCVSCEKILNMKSIAKSSQ